MLDAERLLGLHGHADRAVHAIAVLGVDALEESGIAGAEVLAIEAERRVQVVGPPQDVALDVPFPEADARRLLCLAQPGIGPLELLDHALSSAGLTLQLLGRGGQPAG